jgi:predicted transcriptional regulator
MPSNQKKGGVMKLAAPDKYATTITVRMSEEERHKLKLLAVRERKTLKAVLFEALDRAFPGWQKAQ